MRMDMDSVRRYWGRVVWGVVAAVALAGAAVAQEFPYNGDFEAGAEAPGWQLTGAWEVKPQAARAGRVGLLLEKSEAGDSAVTTGYLPAKPGDSLRLRLAYVCPPGGLRVGLEPCDTLGWHCGEPVWEDLPAAEAWETICRRKPPACGC